MFCFSGGTPLQIPTLRARSRVPGRDAAGTAGPASAGRAGVSNTPCHRFDSCRWCHLPPVNEDADGDGVRLLLATMADGLASDPGPTFPASGPGARIDCILSRGMTVADGRRVRSDTLDHWAIVADLRMG